jgi:hypothetical protein
MMNLEILKKEIELNARFNIIEYNIVSMRVFNLEVNIEISYELVQEIKSQDYNIYLRPSPLEIEIMNELIDEFIKNKDLVNKFIQISRDRKINYLFN